jgi:hypothetical protein
MACSFSASLDPSRLAGRLSSQARYSSCKVINVATAAAQRCGRDGGALGRWQLVLAAERGPTPCLALALGSSAALRCEV